MESMALDTIILFLIAAGMIITFMKDREMDSVLVQAEDSEAKDKREE